MFLRHPRLILKVGEQFDKCRILYQTNFLRATSPSSNDLLGGWTEVRRPSLQGIVKLYLKQEARLHNPKSDMGAVNEIVLPRLTILGRKQQSVVVFKALSKYVFSSKSCVERQAQTLRQK